MGTSFAVLVLLIRLATGEVVVTEVAFEPNEEADAISRCEEAEVKTPPGVTLLARECTYAPNQQT